MDRLKEIVTLPRTTHLSVEQMSFVVERYIKEKRGVNVKIIINTAGIHSPSVIGGTVKLHYIKNIRKLAEAYEHAWLYFRNKC